MFMVYLSYIYSIFMVCCSMGIRKVEQGIGNKGDFGLFLDGYSGHSRTLR